MRLNARVGSSGRGTGRGTLCCTPCIFHSNRQANLVSTFLRLPISLVTLYAESGRGGGDFYLERR